MSDGADQIRAERGRQITSEGYSVEYDLTAGGGSNGAAWVTLIAAAQAYTAAAQGREAGFSESGVRTFGLQSWPWRDEAFKPTTTKRDLVKAGALIAAAIDQLDLAQRVATPMDTRGFDFTSMRGVPADAPAAEEG